MKPKELLVELEKKKGDDYNNGVYEGAKMMREAYLEDGRQRMAKHKAAHPGYHAKWREENREEYNEYQRKYKREKRKLDKGGTMD